MLMQNFRRALIHCDLVDMGNSGKSFKWRNGRWGGEFVEERLDRACAIVEWREMFLATKITHLCVSYSNHDLIMLETQPT